MVCPRRDQRHRHLDPAVLAHLSRPVQFWGRQLHVADYVSAEEFRGLHVIVVGGGISAVGLLDEISKVTTTTWFTRREPVWREAAFDRQAATTPSPLSRTGCARGCRRRASSPSRA